MRLCIYCQINPADTVDHVPPKGLFKEPRPVDLIIVPACSTCNNSFSKDDEYFRILHWNGVRRNRVTGGELSKRGFAL